MAKSNSAGSIWSELFAIGLYKKNQGRVARQLTAVGIGLLVVLGAYTLSQTFSSDTPALIRVGIPTLLAAIGLWVTYRLVNYPRFADFLISVEAEMDKVTWSSREQLFRATWVVIFTMLFFGAILLIYDIFWQWFFKLIGFLEF
ncbi:MAG: preprotein translocase subunit SecE [Planctomycetes bacterium]|nr:preprotein translocase subunit SecE [Planctomycetota bacterium]